MGAQESESGEEKELERVSVLSRRWISNQDESTSISLMGSRSLTNWMGRVLSRSKKHKHLAGSDHENVEKML
jgi:hypothetical protein